MTQKNATPSKRHAEIIESNDISKLTWTVIKELTNTLIVRHRITGEVKVIDKVVKQDEQ